MKRNVSREPGPTSRLHTISQVPVKRKLATRLTLGFILAALIPLAVTAVITFGATERAVKRDVLNRLLLETKAKARAIEDFARRRRRDAAILSREPEVVRAVRTFSGIAEVYGIDSLEYKGAELMFRPFLSYFQETGYVDMLLISPKGKVVYTVNHRSDLGADLGTAPLRDSNLGRVFDMADTLLETEVSNFEVYEPAGRPVSFVASPVMTSSGLVGVVALEIGISMINRSVTDYSGLGRTGEIVLGTRRNGAVVSMAPLRNSPEVRFNDPFPSEEGETLLIHKAVKGRRGKGIRTDYRGREVLAAWRYLPSFDWGMVVKMDTEEAYASIRELRYWWVLIGLLSAAVVVLAALFLARSVSSPLKRLIRATRRIAGGDLAARADVVSADETGQLARSFNRMAVKLEKSKRDLQEYSEGLEKMVDERTADLKRSNRDLEQFAYIASHDLQEPLRMVSSYTELLGRRYEGRLDADADKYIGFAIDGSRRMKQLITDLLTFSRVTSQGKEFLATDCNEVLDDTLKLLEAAVKESAAEVTHDSLPTVPADAGQLRQVFQNLIGNAIKFRGDGPPRVHVGAKELDEAWEMSVADTGIGMEPEYHERIFQMFQRLHARDEYPGTGIGLAVVKKIVERHGGTITVESEPGRGSKFIFTLSKTGGNHG